MYLSPTAVMKQINALEKHLDLILLERSPAGVRLTAAGEVIYQDAKFLLDYSRRSIANARQKMETDSRTFCVGTSMLNPARPFMELWYQVSQEFPNYKLHLVPYEDNHEGILAEIARLGEKFDFLIGVCDSRRWLDQCNMFPLGRYPKMCAVSREHRLAGKECLELSDLYGETLMMVAEGDSGTNDFIRNDLGATIRRSGWKIPRIFMIFPSLTAVRKRRTFTYAGVLEGCTSGTGHDPGPMVPQHSIWPALCPAPTGGCEEICGRQSKTWGRLYSFQKGAMPPIFRVFCIRECWNEILFRDKQTKMQSLKNLGVVFEK